MAGMYTGPVAHHYKPRVAYMYDQDVGNFYYGQGHVMKPHRIRLAHNLIINYNLFDRLLICRPKKVGPEVMKTFHSSEYVDFLEMACSKTSKSYSRQQIEFNIGDDCPIFDGLFDFCSISTAGTLKAVEKLNNREFGIAINWMGGLHHAKKIEASGFCFINDIVIGILELLKHHQRVLYVDIDVHHGDGVEEAFYQTDRVMTVSFHKYGDEYFPGSGALKDIGYGQGKLYSLNVPLKDGITDKSYHSIFNPIMTKVMESYRPGVVVLQCGADSLTGDRLGPFNLTLKGHGECVNFFRKYNLPLLLLGGGGYTPRNVARCWAYETALACGVELPNEIPDNEYMEFYGPDYKLHLDSSIENNMNTPRELERLTNHVLQNLQQLTFAPSVQMRPIPPSALAETNDDEESDDPESPPPRTLEDEGEFYDSEQPSTSTAHHYGTRRNTHDAKRAAEASLLNSSHKRPKH
ncbi:unnamed protein product [Caenorhabditis sp. 36 PRJEB53466]|nr:unnamed protein product [Caenorhabditis sp. 36 PRJEB53466]